MTLRDVNAVYFSPTRTTQKAARAIARGTGLPTFEHNFTLVKTKPQPPVFGGDQLVIVGAPVYGGGIPAVALEYIKGLKGRGTPCVLLALYGNRHFDGLLAQLENILSARGFVPVAAAAFIGEHSFTPLLGKGRPDENDLALAAGLGRDVMEKLLSAQKPQVLPSGAIPGSPYTPADENPQAKGEPCCPWVDESKCIYCKRCAHNCPTGAISVKDVTQIDASKCIRCFSCVKGCMERAMVFDAPRIKESTEYLEANFQAPKQPLIII